MFRMLTLSAVCASFIGLTALASAGPWERKMMHKVAMLEAKRDRAMAHHHPGKAHMYQTQIDGLKWKMSHHMR